MCTILILSEFFLLFLNLTYIYGLSVFLPLFARVSGGGLWVRSAETEHVPCREVRCAGLGSRG